MKLHVCFPVLALLIVAPVHAQQHQGHSPPVAVTPGSTHSGHPISATEKSPSSIAFGSANDKMHKDMAISYSGETDVDFVRGMIPHHQGAIDMARIELQYGKDPETRKLAEGIIAAQESEIAQMKAWLKARGK